MADKASNTNTRAAEAACVEDYNDDSETAVPETRKTANITAKRSKPDVTKSQVVRDEFSDSGHSSQTLATLGSTNSSLESKSGSDTIRAESYAVAGKTRPTKTEEEPHSKSRSPEKPLPPRVASEGRQDVIARKEPCSCSKCVAKARRATPQHPSKPTGKARPPVPEISHPIRLVPAQVGKEAPRPQYAPPRPRALTSHSYHRERPLSLYTGVAPEPFYNQQQQLIYTEPRPTVRYAPTTPTIPPSYPPHPNSYFPPSQQIHLSQPQPQQFFTSPPSPYDIQPRPRPRQWNLDYHPPPRPQSMLYTSNPIIEYVTEPVYDPVPAFAQPPSRRSSHRERSRELSEQRDARDEDYFDMPPPAPLPPPRQKTGSHQDRRPAIRPAVTAHAHCKQTNYRSVGDESTTAHVGHKSSIKPSYGSHERAPRPSRNTSDERVPNTRRIERGMSGTNTESSAAKHTRRASVYCYGSYNEITDEVEAYQASKGNGQTSIPVPIPPQPLTRRKTHTSSKGSETSSRKSGKSGKSRTSRTSRDGSDIKSRRPSESGKFSMRLDVSHGVNVDLKGDMEGRSIRVRQNKDEAEMEFSIGSPARRTVGAGRESREKSRKRCSYRDGQSETEIERTRSMSQPPIKNRGKGDEEDETEPRIIRERITTRTRDGRGNSRAGGERVGFV